MTPVAYLDGRWLPAGQPALPLGTQALHYGTGVFEGIRAYATATGRPVLFEPVAHFERMLRSCDALRIDLGSSVAELTAIAVDLIERNDLREHAYVRPLAFKSSLMPGTPFGVRLRGIAHQLAMTVLPMPRRNGAACTLWPSAVVRTPPEAVPSRAKITGGYVNNALAVDEATGLGFDDALLLNARGHVTEASTSNLFVVRGGRLVTPPMYDGILAGVTRATVMRLAARMSIPTDESSLLLDDVVTAHEVFLTGTGLEISPALRVGSTTIGNGTPGPVTRALVAAYDALVGSSHPGGNEHDRALRAVPTGARSRAAAEREHVGTARHE